MRALTYILETAHGQTDYFRSSEPLEKVRRMIAPSRVVGIRTIIAGPGKGPIIIRGNSGPSWCTCGGCVRGTGCLGAQSAQSALDDSELDAAPPP